MKIVILFLLLAYSAKITSQTSNLSIGLKFCPSFSYRQLTSNFLFEETDKPILGISGSVCINYKLTNRLTFEMGFGISRTGFNEEKKVQIISSYFPGTPIQLYNYATSIASYRFIYLDLPFVLKYQLITISKFSFKINGGFMFNSLITSSENVIYKIDNKEIDMTNSVTKRYGNLHLSNSSYVVGIECNYLLSPRLKLIASPTFISQLYHIENGVNTYTKLYRLGFDIGVLYRI